MFDTAELGQRVDDADFRQRQETLRRRLLPLQYRCLELARFPVIIDFAGVDGAGKGTTINMLNTWMDPRWMRTIGYQAPTEVERGRPRFWRFWRDLPPKGRIGLYLSGRYSEPLLQHVMGDDDETTFDQRLAEIIRFEKALADDGALIIKFWMHLNRAAQKARLSELEKDPLQSYKVSTEDWRLHERYEDFIAAAKTIVSLTHRADTPWRIIDGTDANHRHLQVGEFIADELQRHLALYASGESSAATDRRGEEPAVASPPATVFDRLDLSRAARSNSYAKKLQKRQAKLGELGRRAFASGQSTVLVFEGPDASGKGGAIRRTVWSLDARACRVHQFAAPTEEERAQHYLWRFWRRLPPAGHMAIFDRSWYGRVLVERAEGLASKDEWRRAYNEINDFEKQIVDHGTLLLKFWLHIDNDEQYARFKSREASPYKQWKLTDDDWRNRELWSTYLQLGHDVFQFTDTHVAPWIPVEANDKMYARLKVLKAVIEHLKKKVD